MSNLPAINRTYSLHTWSLGVACAAALVIGCSEMSSPATPGATPAPPLVQTDGASGNSGHGHAHGLDADKGHIDGWFDGRDVDLFYTKLYFCEEPPSSGAPTDCVIGADAEVPPRGGPLPTIYALAPVGFQPDPATLSCLAGSPCLNHPAMIDASRIAGPNATNVPAVSHSHVLGERRGGWFHTVNIRVFSAAAWNQIAASKSLDTIRALQGNPATGAPGVISADTPTNIFFFIASFTDK